MTVPQEDGQATEKMRRNVMLTSGGTEEKKAAGDESFGERKRCKGKEIQENTGLLKDERTEGKELQTNHHCLLSSILLLSTPIVDFCVGESCSCFILIPTQHFWSHYAVK